MPRERVEPGPLVVLNNALAGSLLLVTDLVPSTKGIFKRLGAFLKCRIHYRTPAENQEYLDNDLKLEQAHMPCQIQGYYNMKYKLHI